MKKLTILTIAALLCTGLQAQTTQKLTANKSNEYGLIYSLPTTALDIVIEVEKRVEQPGEDYKYAPKYLKANNPITAPSQTATVKSVTVIPHGVKNEEEQYLMQFKNGSAPFLILKDENLPTAINPDEPPAADTPDLPVAVPAAPTPLESDAARQAVSEEMMQSQSHAKRAEIAASQIFDLRQSRSDLITGQADQMPPDGQALQLVLDNIAAQEAALTAMFMGTVQCSTQVKTVTYIPGDEDLTNEIVARVSAVDGVTDVEDLSGTPLYLSMEVIKRGALPVNDKGEEKKFPKGGVAYCIPGTAAVKISFNGKTFYQGNVDLAQLGVVFGLDPGLFTDKKAPAYLLLNPATGAITELGTLAQ